MRVSPYALFVRLDIHRAFSSRWIGKIAPALFTILPVFSTQTRQPIFSVLYASSDIVFASCISFARLNVPSCFPRAPPDLQFHQPFRMNFSSLVVYH